MSAVLELEDLAFDQGGRVLLKHALRGLPVGDRLEVRGARPELGVHLRAWCRAEGHAFEAAGPGRYRLSRGPAEEQRWAGAARAGGVDPGAEGAVRERPPQAWGLAARGARVEAGGPRFRFPLKDKVLVWAEDAPRLYAQAAAAQWDPESAIPWGAEFAIPDAVEDAIVQVMTYLIENETAALLVPSAFLARIHPHFREVMQLLAIQVADEARHIEVFTRRAKLRRGELGLSTSGGQASLKTLLDETDFALASFLLSVLGEGSFLQLLWFLHEHAPDPVTKAIMTLAAQDEARHVAFGLAHLARHARLEPGLRPRLRAAIEGRHDKLKHSSGLNEEVLDALVLIAGGGFEAEALRRGAARVSELKQAMDRSRRQYLTRLGFSEEDAAELSALHTRNFM